MLRIGLYGGSFDPVHIAHLLVAQAAHEEVQLDRVVFIPAAQSPFKPDYKPTPNQLRAQLLRLALAGRTYCEIDTQELDRGGISYTIETVRNYRQRFPTAEIFYLIGSDHVAQLPKWRDSAELASTVEFIIILRPGTPTVDLPPGFKGRHLHGFPLGLSSSQIRERVRRGLPIDLLTGVAVSEAIRHNRLYLSQK